jgi:putative lipoprotein
MFRARFTVTIACIVTLAAAVAMGQSSASGPMITGTISYTARMALPANAAVDVRLEDVSLADAPSKLVAENIFALGGNQVPVPFQLPYKAAEIQPSHRYTVRASISVDGNLLFTTTETYPVLTNGGPSDVALTLQAVRHGSSQPTVAPNALRGTRWVLTELHGKPVAPSANNPAFILLDPDYSQYSGSSGCNRVSGKFQLSGESLQLLGGAMTMMACPEPLMNQEKEFNEALTATGSYQLSGSTLELLARKKVLAKFTAAPAQAGN